MEPGHMKAGPSACSWMTCSKGKHCCEGWLASGDIGTVYELKLFLSWES